MNEDEAAAATDVVDEEEVDKLLRLRCDNGFYGQHRDATLLLSTIAATETTATTTQESA